MRNGRTLGPPCRGRGHTTVRSVVDCTRHRPALTQLHHRGNVGAVNADVRQDAVIEDENTVHWFYNRGSEPATAIVCDIKPAS